MTKLQTIEAEIQTLSIEEQKELISKFVYLVSPNGDDVFELTEAELADLDDRIKNDTVTFTHAEVMDSLREKYAADNGAK